MPEADMRRVLYDFFSFFDGTRASDYRSLGYWILERASGGVLMGSCVIVACPICL